MKPVPMPLITRLGAVPVVALRAPRTEPIASEPPAMIAVNRNPPFEDEPDGIARIRPVTA